MDALTNLALGFQVAGSLDGLLFCFIGVSVGTFVGALPGLGALVTITMLLPVTFHLDPVIALIMLAGIFYGAQYGNSITSILLNIPGTPSSAVTCLDGYPMAKAGRAGQALFMTAAASFVGGSLAILLLMWFAPRLASVAMHFSSADFFSVLLLALVGASTLSAGSPIKGLTMVAIGIVLGLVGTDINSGVERFTFGFLEFKEGLSLVAVAMGLFGIAEILTNIGRAEQGTLIASRFSLRSMLPTRDDVKMSVLPILRGSALGSWIGILPGAGPSIASFMSYAAEKKLSKDPSRFGKGAIEGVTAPEASNNAAVQAAFIPTLSLGIPGDAVMAVLMGAMLIHGITPGPQFISSNPTMFWGLIASFWIGNVMLLIINIPLINIWTSILSIPYRILYPAMLFFIAIGVYSINNSGTDVVVAVAFGIWGYFMARYGYSGAPLLLGLIMGPMLEEYLRRSLLLSRGSFWTFVDRPMSATFIGLTMLILIWPLLKKAFGIRRLKEPLRRASRRLFGNPSG